jgi:hypothetical protein
METNKALYGNVTAIFLSSQDVNQAYDSLIRRGYSPEEITVVMTDETRSRQFHSQSTETDEHSSTMSDAGRGALIGGATGALVTTLAVIGSNLMLPGLGLVLAGPLVAALTGAAAGSIAGGTIGAIIGSGYSEDEKVYYETSIKEGGIMLSVRPKTETDRELIIDDFRTFNGQRVLENQPSMMWS